MLFFFSASNSGTIVAVYCCLSYERAAPLFATPRSRSAKDKMQSNSANIDSVAVFIRGAGDDRTQ